uniref:Uncharacterized protein n=1 Tax=Brugia timori TaxID=42155 RepID=A0A0R3R099_9BILA
MAQQQQVNLSKASSIKCFKKTSGKKIGYIHSFLIKIKKFLLNNFRKRCTQN